MNIGFSCCIKAIKAIIFFIYVEMGEGVITSDKFLTLFLLKVSHTVQIKIKISNLIEWIHNKLLLLIGINFMYKIQFLKETPSNKYINCPYK